MLKLIPISKKQHYFIKAIFWFIAVVLGSLQAWSNRYNLSSGDVISYLDITREKIYTVIERTGAKAIVQKPGDRQPNYQAASGWQAIATDYLSTKGWQEIDNTVSYVYLFQN